MSSLHPIFADSCLVHRVAVDRLRWELGQPVPPLPSHTACCYCNGDSCSSWCRWHWLDPYLCCPGLTVSSQCHYSLGYRAGLKSAAAALASASRSQTQASPYAAQEAKPRQTVASAADSKTLAPAAPEGVMGFPTGSYRRTLTPMPVSSDTSIDNLAPGWPFGCKPFYFRPADPPSVRYCMYM